MTINPFPPSLDGHDSLQDAVVALELALLKARMGENFGLIGPFAEEIVPKCSLFEPLITNAHVCSVFFSVYQYSI